MGILGFVKDSIVDGAEQTAIDEAGDALVNTIANIFDVKMTPARRELAKIVLATSAFAAADRLPRSSNIIKSRAEKQVQLSTVRVLKPKATGLQRVLNIFSRRMVSRRLLP